MTLEPVQRDVPRTFERPSWLDEEEFPFESRVVEIDGNQIHYVDEAFDLIPDRRAAVRSED